MTAAPTGIFAKDEKCIVFLDVIQELVEKTLADAFRAAAAGDTTSPPRFTPYVARRFLYAIDLIKTWPSDIIEMEKQTALKLAPQIMQCYAHLVTSYSKEFPGLPREPSFRDFLHKIYKQVIQAPEIRNGVYFTLVGWPRKSVIADAIRAALRTPSYVAETPDTPDTRRPETPLKMLPLPPPPAPAPAPLRSPPVAPPSKFQKAIIEVDLGARSPLQAPPTPPATKKEKASHGVETESVRVGSHHRA